MSSIIVLGDTHTSQPLSNRLNTEAEELAVSLASYTVELMEYLSEDNPVISVGDLVLNQETSITDAMSWVDAVSHPTGLIHCIGNHDWDAYWAYESGVGSSSQDTPYITEDIKSKTNIMPHGNKNSGLTWHDVELDNVRVICINNIQDVEDSIDTAYPYNNPSGGVADMDWMGISEPASPQRIFIRDTLADAAAKDQIVVVVGHRPTYGVHEPELASDFRPNHTEALDETLVDVGGTDYPKGWLLELEDWCVENQTHAIFLNGDQHCYGMTKPVYRGTPGAEYGVVHINLVSGPYNRAGEALDTAMHISYHYNDGTDTIPHNLPFDINKYTTTGRDGYTAPAGLPMKGYFNYLEIDLQSDKLQFKYMTIQNYISGYDPVMRPQIIDAWYLNRSGAKLTGQMLQNYNVLTAPPPTIPPNPKPVSRTAIRGF